MKYAIIGLSLFFAQTVTAQIFTLKNIKSKDETKSFIIVESKERPLIANKISAAIQNDWGYDPKAKDPFENRPDDEEAPVSADIASSNERVFGITMTSSYAACGLHIDRRDYIFDAKTGAAIDKSKIFGADGDAKLNKSLHKTWVAALKAAAANKDDSRREEYANCLKNAADAEFSLNRMMVNNGGISFWAGSCLEGTAYDFEADRSKGPHEYSWSRLLPMLTQYGFSLFIDNPAAPLRTLMRGTIDGKYPISLALLPGNDAGSITGSIVYDRVGEPINIKGTVNGNQIKFNELDESGNALSDIEVSWDGTKLTGSFTNLKSKKQMPFLATAIK